MNCRIALLNIQSGVNVTRGYWEYLLKSVRYAFPHGSEMLASLKGLVRSHDVDALVLLEAEAGSVRTRGLHQVEYASKVSGFAHNAFFGNMHLSRLVNLGHGVVSKHPLEAYASTLLPSRGSPRSLGSSRILIGETQLHLLSTHLSLGRRSRKAQIERIAALACSLPADEPVLLAGDFNIRDESEFEPLLEAGFTSVSTPSTYPSWNPTHALQRFFTRNCELTKVEQSDMRISDHLPLIASVVV